MGALGITALSSFSCERRPDVNREIEDLKQAQQAAPQVAQDLRQKLDQKKTELVQLEEKLALAERGITDRVVAERGELQQAIKSQEQAVKREVDEARGASHMQQTETERAREALEATRPSERVEADVKTERKEIPNDTRVEVERKQEQLPLETYRTVERPAKQPAEQQPAQPAQQPAQPTQQPAQPAQQPAQPVQQPE